MCRNTVTTFFSYLLWILQYFSLQFFVMAGVLVPLSIPISSFATNSANTYYTHARLMTSFEQTPDSKLLGAVKAIYSINIVFSSKTSIYFTEEIQSFVAK